MARFGAIVQCGAVMVAVWAVIGLPIALRTSPRPLSVFLAPALGWAIYSVLALPLFSLIGMSRPVLLATTAVSAAGAFLALWGYRPIKFGRPSAPIILAIAGAAILSLAAMAAIVPKETADGVTLAGPVFDHSKIALVDEMIRSGVPARNPFFDEIGAPERVSYYYLWHFSAAAMAVVTGASGWEADAALTWFTAFATLAMMIGLAVWISGRASAGLVVLALAATSSMRSIVEWLLGLNAARGLIGWATGFGGWLFQTSWAPQHVASAMCVVLAFHLISQMRSTRGPLLPIVLALTVAAGFECSVWVGGITFVIAAVMIGLAVLWNLERIDRTSFIVRVAVAAALAAVLAGPFLYDQIATTALRDGGSPVSIAPLQVLGDGIPRVIRRVLDLPAYWLVYLPLEFPAYYPVGMVALFFLSRSRAIPDDRRLNVRIFAILVAVSLGAAWLLVSVVGDNNDLGWRAVLPAVLLLIPLAAAGLMEWAASRARFLVAFGFLGMLIGLPGGILLIGSNVIAEPLPSGRLFAATPAMWEAVRRHSGPGDRVVNNPYFLSDMTSWPVNISWALLADRRSCYAGWELAIPFAPISASRRAEVDALFVRVFEGRPAPDDIARLVERHRCDVIVVTPQDGAWSRDPFASNTLYRAVESRPDAWRVYRRTAAQGR